MAGSMVSSRRPQARAGQLSVHMPRVSCATTSRMRHKGFSHQQQPLHVYTGRCRSQRLVIAAGLFGRGGPRDPLSGPLKNGQSFSLDRVVWTAYEDPASGAMYYYNSTTGVTQWADPRPGASEAQPYAVDRPQVARELSTGMAPRAPPQLSEVQVKALAGAGITIFAYALFRLGRIIFGRRQQPEDEYFPLGISESMNEDLIPTSNASQSAGFLVPSQADKGNVAEDQIGSSHDDPPAVEEFFLPGSGAALGLSSQDLEASRTATWDDNLTTIEDIEPPGPDSEELPPTEEFFLPGSGASRGLTSQDLEASRTATWDDNLVTIDDVEAPGPDSEELPPTEEFFLPGSGASRGLTSQDLETSRTATWDDNLVTIEDVEVPGPESEELPYTEEYFLPGSGASRGLTSQDLEASRTATWDDNTATLDEEEEVTGAVGSLSSPPSTSGSPSGSATVRPPADRSDSPSQPGFQTDSSGGPSTMDIAEKAANATRDVERLRERLDREFEATVEPAAEAAVVPSEVIEDAGSTPHDDDEAEVSIGKALVDGAISDEEAAEWDQEALAFVEEEMKEAPQQDTAIEVEATVVSPEVEPQEQQSEVEGPAPELDDAALIAEQIIAEDEGTQIKRRTPTLPDDVPSDSSEVLPVETVMRCGVCMIPHPARVKTEGEDAYFFSNSGHGAVGIADGVGSWAVDGIDPAAFARQLVSNVQTALDVAEWRESEMGLRLVLHAAHSSATAPGSATVIVAAGGNNGVVHVANLGDCGLRVITDGVCHFATKDMLHEYNTPYQLARMEEQPEKQPENDPDNQADQQLEGQTEKQTDKQAEIKSDSDAEPPPDSPEHAELYDIEVSPGDILVVASDGLFDNVFDDEVASIADSVLREEWSVAAAERAASALAQAAVAKVKNLRSRTPWVEAAAAAKKLPPLQRMRPRGGKMDDITVAVCLIDAA